jgi:hypothetical protein
VASQEKLSSVDLRNNFIEEPVAIKYECGHVDESMRIKSESSINGLMALIYVSIYLTMNLQSFAGPWPLFTFLIL